jgi:flavin-dependent thymidylate synthase
MPAVTPSVRLIDFQPNALDILIYTKNTRLKAGETIDTIARWPMEQKIEHLGYMKDTIKSSWEFVSYTFEIENVSRAFTHQLVRSRNGSYAQQSQRTVSEVEDYVLPPFLADEPITPSAKISKADWLASALDDEMDMYRAALELGFHAQDARALLPTHVATSIIARFNLRTLHEMALVRLCTRVQGEYQSVFRMMRDLVYHVHPYFAGWIEVQCVQSGTCAFPRYKECPIHRFTWDGGAIANRDQVKRVCEKKWNELRHEAKPIADKGRTM